MQTFEVHNTSATGALDIGSTPVIAGQTKPFTEQSGETRAIRQDVNAGNANGQSFTVKNTSPGGALEVSVDGNAVTDVPAGQIKTFSIASQAVGFVRQDANVGGAAPADSGTTPGTTPPSDPSPRR